jgi:hypothetical protein
MATTSYILQVSKVVVAPWSRLSHFLEVRSEIWLRNPVLYSIEVKSGRVFEVAYCGVLEQSGICFC